MTEARMTIGQHLEELRLRLVRCLLATFAGFVLAWWQIDRVIAFMRRPLDPEVELIQTRAFDGFFGAMKISFFAGLIVALPVIFYQIWAFVGAGLYQHEKRAIKFYAFPGFALFVAGAWLAWAYVTPYALEFLIGFSEDDLGIRSLLSFSEYVSLIALSLFVFGLVFQLPVLMVFLMRIGVVEPDTFRRWRRGMIVGFFAVGMILTPPDVISQVALAACMAVLYEAAILIGASISRPRRTPEDPPA